MISVFEVEETGLVEPRGHPGDKILDGVEGERGLSGGELVILLRLRPGGDGDLLAGLGGVARLGGFLLGFAGDSLLAQGLPLGLAGDPFLLACPVALDDSLTPLPGDPGDADDRARPEGPGSARRGPGCVAPTSPAAWPGPPGGRRSARRRAIGEDRRPKLEPRHSAAWGPFPGISGRSPRDPGEPARSSGWEDPATAFGPCPGSSSASRPRRAARCVRAAKRMAPSP